MNTQKPFDITKPFKTRDGREVEIKFTDGREMRKIGGYVGNEEDLRTWKADGRHCYYNETQSPLDLINISNTHNLMTQKEIDIAATKRVLSLGAKCLNPDLFCELEEATKQIEESIINRNEQDKEVLLHATWQQRIIALAKVKGMEIS